MAVDLGYTSTAIFWGRVSSSGGWQKAAPGTPGHPKATSHPRGDLSTTLERMQPQSTCPATGGEPGEGEVSLPLDYRRL